MISNVKATKGIGDNVLEKTIHKGSESIMFSVLQETQYMYPFKSSVREIVSNSVDSINERNNALKILSGEINIQDLFIEKEGEEFNDSRFDTEYYDKKWLSTNNTVIIRYIENDTVTRDRIQFIDEGVGLGDNRLVNYFNLGFSTKRLSKSQLGNFGLGAKSLLATGVDFYTTTSYYNGKKFKFNIFKDHIVSITDKFNEINGSKNKTHKFYNGYECYYEDTLEKNKVIIESEVKRHRKQDYINAIESQLGFIDNIKLLISDKTYDIIDSERDFKSNVLYRTDKILVGDTDYYARPQILLRPGDDSNIMINYGTINFDELEMKRYTGNVSFIMNINDVDVTPSRESVIWNTKTRNAIKNMFIEAQNTIADIISEKIKGAVNLPQHLSMLETFKSKNSVSGLGELYKVIDISEIDLSYKTFKIKLLNEEIGKEKKFIFTSTEKSNSWRSTGVAETNFDSKISKKYIANLYNSNNKTSNVIVYIGKTKYKDLARYAYSKFLSNDSYIESVDIIYINAEYYEDFKKRVETEAKDLEDFLDISYTKQNQIDILIGEVLLSIKGGTQVLLEKDIDKVQMKKLGEVAEEVSNNRYLTDAEKAKLEDKVAVYRYNGHYKVKTYYNEDDLLQFISNGQKVYLYRLSKDGLAPETYSIEQRVLDNKEILGCSEEVYKRLIKVGGVKPLTDGIFKIEFGDLYITRLGRALIGSRTKITIDNGENFSDSTIGFLNNTFANVGIDVSIFTRKVNDKVNIIINKVAKFKEPQLEINNTINNK